MAGRMSAATERAVARVAGGETGYAAAKAEGINLATIYRALGRLRDRLGVERPGGKKKAGK